MYRYISFGEIEKIYDLSGLARALDRPWDNNVTDKREWSEVWINSHGVKDPKLTRPKGYPCPGRSQAREIRQA